MKKFVSNLIVYLLISNTLLLAQTKKNWVELKWRGVHSEKIDEVSSRSFFDFEGAFYEKNIAFFTLRTELENNNVQADFEISDMIFDELTPDEILFLKDADIQQTELKKQVFISQDKNKAFAILKLNPFRINPLTGKLEKLIAFNYQLITNAILRTAVNSEKKSYAAHSVLSIGNWYKLAVQNTGIYKITYNDLVAMGINVATLNPANISVFGNGQGMLPELNSAFRYDDLQEIPIYIEGGNDGVFGAGDYILFYGHSPVNWKYNNISGEFEHQINYYSDNTYYYITTTAGIGSKKRMTTATEPVTPANKTITSFNDYACHHRELFNLASSGKIWLGELFSFRINNYIFPFNFPDIIADSNINVKYSLYARSTANSQFIININGLSKNYILSSITGSSTNTLASYIADTMTLKSGSPVINVNLLYNYPLTSSEGYLNYIEINAYRNLRFSGNQISFRSIESIGSGNISQFNISNASSSIKVIDITDPLNASFLTTYVSGTNLNFKIATDTLKEFIAFDGSSFFSAQFVGKMANQDLHGLTQQDYVIVSHPLFLSEANRLADFHRTHDNLKVVVVSPEQIYNEFSSGAQDPTAIRSFMKMFYDRASSSTDAPKYLLLFGDGSYDNKRNRPTNTNFIVTYQSDDSFSGWFSYVTDDYYGFLDNSESGTNFGDAMDIGIGRFPVKSLDEAKILVDKVFRYTSKYDLAPNSQNVVSNYADWKNTICFVADDEDGNAYLDGTEFLSNIIKTNNPIINVDKIYLDAYVQVSNSGGARYPEVNNAINQRVERGALIINYMGHGGKLGWAHERVLEISDILKWKNTDNLPIFFTATCDFSPFDDTLINSAGELVLLSANGGSIALFTTTRVAYQGNNQTLNNNFFNKIYKKVNGEYLSFGDLMRIAKNEGSNDALVRNFVLLGDPALKPAYPEYNVVTTEINGIPSNLTIDTLNAMSTITIKGIITDENNNKITNYNGVLYPTIFDKPLKVTSLGNDPGSLPVRTFELPKAILYKGKASIVNGNFEFSFVVPKDIAYNYGYGKISYYAKNDTSDACGYFNNIIVGGFNTTVIPDITGPEIRLFMNDTNFISGGITDQNPTLLALIKDPNGINTVGNGIGHDIVAYLDNDNNNPILLNDYYISDLNNFEKGQVYYPFSKLTDGLHTLKLKAWDVFNNSAEANIEFIVAQSANIALTNVLNYPNPFSDKTSFIFEHNQVNTDLDIQIQIYNINGKLIKTIKTNINTDSYKISPIEWDGSTDSGEKIGKGLYIYRLIVRNPAGNQNEKTNKLVFLR
ncbi:MAG: type IX secretion system sortase PorU [Bacteroidetes bacterium]|nr:type IX secretion system sortase PorU [Bacteroidota bacterium]